MATIYSLVCWLGSGQTVTFTDAGDLVNLTAHGVRQYEYGTTKMVKRVQFTSTGSLPTDLLPNTDYYVVRSTDNALILYPSNSDAIAGTNQVTFSSTGSGTHTMRGGYYLSLTSEQKLRYGSAGSERIYNGLIAMNAARVSADIQPLDTEICELAESFTELHTASYYMQFNCISEQITASVSGIRTSAFHGGITGAGFIYYTTKSYESSFVMQTKPRKVIDGWSMCHHGQQSVLIFMVTTANGSVVKNMLLYSDITNNYVGGIYAAGLANEVYNNIIHSFHQVGFERSSYGRELMFLYNNLVCKCGAGYYGGQYECYINAFNNIAIGNTTNWGTEPNAIEQGDYNAGASGNSPWSTGVDTSVVISTSDFMDYANNDFRPASSTSPQVCSGMDLSVYGLDGHDVIGRVRPSWYEDDGDWLLHTAWSIGPFEYNFGDPPVSYNLTIASQNATDLVDAQISIYDADGTIVGDMGTEIFEVNNNSSADVTYTHNGTTNDVYIQVIKHGYIEQVIPYTLRNENQSIYIDLEVNNNE